MMARKPGSRSNALRAVHAPPAAAFGWSSGCSPRLTAAPSAATAAMTQIRCRAAMTSTSSPQASAPTTKAAEPHSRSGP